jgi:hypothetical protein
VSPQDSGRVVLNTNLAAGSTSTLIVKDEKTAKLVAGPRISVVGASPFKLTSVTVNPTLWTVGPTYRISWQGTGAPTSTETVSLLYSTAKGVLRLASGIPANQGGYNYSVGSVTLKNTTGQLVIMDEMTSQSINGSAIQIH